ncbi:MAG TPA: hypothetical protein VJ436_00465 [Anaerolineales bacterium]|nr:hypothetical protein [Anaerolineales bacterium]
MRSNLFRTAWGLSLLVAAALGCNLINVIPEDLRDAAGTAQAVATQIGTQSESLATAFQEGLGTAQAIATQEGPSLLATGQAALTEAAQSGVLQTAQAKITEEAANALATLRALGTQGLSPDNVPADIPIIEDPEPVDLFTTSSTVSYTTSLSLQEALEFYKQEMIAHGWTYISNGSLETANLAVLWYETSDQDASVTLNASSPGGETLVLISVVPK